VANVDMMFFLQRRREQTHAAQRRFNGETRQGISVVRHESQGAGEGTPEDATCRAILETDKREGRLLRGISKTNMGNHYRMNWEQLKRKRKEDPYIEEDEDLRREGLSENVIIS
jgi:hypothetical protein